MESLKSGEVFMDDRNRGVSLQRGRYTNVQFCKNSAEKIKNKEFIGFLIFKKESYLLACSEMKKFRDKFQSELRFTPLDINGDYLSEINEIAINQFGNPSHADIFYLEPSMMMTNWK